VACSHLLGEVRKTLRKPYFRKRIDKSAAEDALAMLEAAGVMRKDPKAVEEVLRDPTDDYLVALAREADAEAIVSGDKDLLDHAGLEPPAINAREACELLGLN
jgi:putative PIN family toxin of toxin-antitoxin system